MRRAVVRLVTPGTLTEDALQRVRESYETDIADRRREYTEKVRELEEVNRQIVAVELRLALESRLRVDLPLMSLAEGTSVASIATRLANAVSARPQASEVLSIAERYEVADDDHDVAHLAQHPQVPGDQRLAEHRDQGLGLAHAKAPALAGAVDHHADRSSHRRRGS